MKVINCIIADDEKLAREVLQSHISKLPGLKVVATCATGTEVYNSIKDNPVDLVFLDIQMPQLTGIELSRILKKPPPVILTTAYREFAVEGYELNVIDYLLKPVSFERFLKAVEKYHSLNSAQSVGLKPAPVNADEHGFIYVKSNKKLIRLLLKDILYIEGIKESVKICTKNAELISAQTLSRLEEKLSSDLFMRVHRSYIISINQVSGYTSSYVEIGNKAIPIGKTYLKEIAKKLRFDVD